LQIWRRFQVAKSIDAAVIGGGVNGLMTAHKLLRRGFGRVVVFESNVIGSGQSSRNAGGIRAQFGNEKTIRLMSEAIRLWSGLSRELDYNILFKQDGYIFVCYSDEDVSIYSRARERQNRNGIKTRWLEADEVSEVVPGINREGLVGANFHSLDGTLHHDAVLHGLMFSIERNGGLILEHTPVVRISKREDEFILSTLNGEFSSQYVVNATASKVNELSSQLGIKLPVWPVRRELIATEPLKSLFKPMLVSLKYGITIHQSLRGEFVGHTHAEEPQNYDISASLNFMIRFAKDIIKLLPFMKYVKIVRQWAGTYDMTPDSSPVLGPVGELAKYIVIAGSSGHGFMLSPAVGHYISEYIATGRVDELLRPFLPERFERNELIEETLLSNSSVL
jgi:sarcosine oxidase subunit beta